MNPKLNALYKELPWLTVLKKEIGDPGVVKVQRLDEESAQRFVGSIQTSDDSYWIKGYFFDEKGNIVSKISHRPVGIMRYLRSLWNNECTTVEDALVALQKRDDVKYVALFGYDINHYSQTQLYVYKMPQGRTTSEFLREIAEQRAHKIADEFNKASDEVSAELSE